jgi:predicted nuclease with TOPRIM domain
VSIIERASWMMEKMGALIEQLRQDRETLRNQKKEVGKENDKLKVRIEALEYENSQLLKELKVTIEKFKCLEDKNFKIVNIPFSEKFEFSQKTSHPMLETEFPK